MLCVHVLTIMDELNAFSPNETFALSSLQKFLNYKLIYTKFILWSLKMFNLFKIDEITSSQMLKLHFNLPKFII